MPAVGYDDANQSHFTSRHYWEVGETNPFGRWGWLGRYLDEHGAPDNPLQGLSLGWDLSPVLAARDVPVATVDEPDNYDFWTPASGGRCRTRCWTPSATSASPPPRTSGSARRAPPSRRPARCATSSRPTRTASRRRRE